MQDGSLWKRADGSLWRCTQIPTNNQFLEQYLRWTLAKVSSKYKRDRNRMPDTVQSVRTKLLQKDFIGRWFFKHLTDELVDRDDASRILGDTKLKFTKRVVPVHGKRQDADSLWRVKDLLDYAKFDHRRYFYSVRGHTIDSNSVLQLIGYPPGSFNVLKSLYIQGRLKPSEFTQHECRCSQEKHLPVGGKCSVSGCGRKHLSRGFCCVHYKQLAKTSCPVCEEAKATLKSKGLSLADDWMKSPHAAQLRWNDAQLRPFLRNWREQNIVKTIPTKVVRPHGQPRKYEGVIEGLLKYAQIVINNAIINEFKWIHRNLETPHPSVGYCDGDEDGVATSWDSGEDGESQIIVKDNSALHEFSKLEVGSDVTTLMAKADLSTDELRVISDVDLSETDIKEYAQSVGDSVSNIHKIRNSALEKMRRVDTAESTIRPMLEGICQKYGCEPAEVLGPSKVGVCVIARAEFFYSLYRLGMSIEEISTKIDVPCDRVSLAVSRGHAKHFSSSSA